MAVTKETMTSVMTSVSSSVASTSQVRVQTPSSTAAAAAAACDVCQERVEPTSTSITAAHSARDSVDVTRQVRSAPVAVVVLVDENYKRKLNENLEVLEEVNKT